MSLGVRSWIFDRVAPLLFVVIWSTGWIAARFSAEYADPLTFLTVRFACAGALMIAIARVANAPFPRSSAVWRHALISGVLLHTIYLGGVWWAIRHGLPASISALLAAIQPIATALLAPALLGEKLSARRWLGVLLGGIGLCVALSPKLASTSIGGEAIVPIVVNVVGMLGVTSGYFYQKRFLPTGDLRAIAGLQYLGAFLAMAPLAFLLEPMRLEWNATTALTLAWSVLALSIGAIFLLLLLIRHGEVSRSAQLIYLVPPIAALQAAALFGERLDAVNIVGMALTAVGVALASRS
jgi:drug/metabolite transporter (DMT)-like permease